MGNTGLARMFTPRLNQRTSAPIDLPSVGRWGGPQVKAMGGVTYAMP